MHQILDSSMNAYEEIFQEIDTTNLLEQKELFIFGQIKILKVEN